MNLLRGFLLAMSFCSLAGPPNILFIVSEDNGPELSCYGQPYVRTPHLDRLAAEGTRFDRAYVPQAGCSQSRAAFLTGLYPHQNGQIGLATWKFRMYRDDAPNMVRSLKDAGYRTGIIGKLHVNPASAFPFDFKQVESANFGRKRQAKYAEHAREFFAASDKPFFLQVNYPDAHRPFIKQIGGLPAKPLSAKDVKTLAYIGLDTPVLRQQTADYLNCMMRLDSLIGDLLAQLKASGKYDNTLIVYIGDHGADLIRGKRTCYEGGLRIPMILRTPQGKPSQVRKELVSTLDLFPTFIQASGAKAVSGLPGKSLLPLLDGKTPPWRDSLAAEYHLHSNHNYFPQRSICGDRYKLIESLQPDTVNPGYDFCVNKFLEPGEVAAALAKASADVRAAYAIERRPPQFQLYDLSTDPYEFSNLAEAPAHAAAFRDLKGQLTAWRQTSQDPLLNPANVSRLKAEIEATRVGKDYSKAKIGAWKYPDYFFQDARPKPNVLFLASDDLRTTLGCYGDPIAKTPNLDALAASGTLFERAYCQQAVCNPSRASLLTGLRPATLKIWNLSSSYRKTTPSAVTLPEFLISHGYHSEQIGKIHHGSGAPSHDPKSWSVPQLMHHVTKRDQYRLAKNRSGRKEAATERADAPESDYIDGKVADFAIAALARLADQDTPFFLAVGFRKPHLPFSAPAKYWDLYDRAAIPLPGSAVPIDCPDFALRSWKELAGYSDIDRDAGIDDAKRRELWHGYYAAVSFMDAQVGKVLAALDANGLADNTIVVFWSDHGFHLSEHSLWAKTSNFELDAHVPLITRFPGHGKAGQRSPALVELVDMYPSIVEACGLPVPSSLEGRSFLPLLANPQLPWKPAAFTQHPRPAYYGKKPGVIGYSMRTDRYRYTEWRKFGSSDVLATELYDHSLDPGETASLATSAAHKATVQRLRKQLAAGPSLRHQ
ncbi:MAG: iduronate 2-sulfatase [Rhodothermales bacterium]|jgi:iduronate 2-sulfatase